MPKKEEEIISYNSLVHLSKRLNEIQGIEDRRLFVSKYVLAYDHNYKQDYSFEEAIHIAKMKVADAAAKAKLRASKDERAPKNPKNFVNPYAPSKDADLANQMFMNDPVEYLKGYANQELDRVYAIEDPSDADCYIKGGYAIQTVYLDDSLKQKVAALEDNNVFDVKVRLEGKLGSKKALEDLNKATEAGFWSKRFNTTSLAGKNLEKAYKAFNDPKHAYYGNLPTIEKAGIEYLQHKFPGWKPGQPFPNEEQIGRLDKTSKARTLLSIGLIEAAQEQKLMKDYLKDMSSNKNIRYDAVKEADKREAVEAEKRKEKEDFINGAKQEEQNNAMEDKNFMDVDVSDTSIADEELIQTDYDKFQEMIFGKPTDEEQMLDAVDKLGDSFLETENLEKAKAEEERIRKYEEDKMLQEKLKEDLDLGEDFDIDTAKQEKEFEEELKKLQARQNEEEESYLDVTDSSVLEDSDLEP